MTVYDIRPLLAVGVTAAACVIILFLGKRPNVRDGVTVAAAFAKAGLVFSMAPGVLAGKEYTFTLFSLTDELSFTLKTDAAGMVFACVSSFLYVIVAFYAIGYMRGHHEKEQTGFYAFFALCLCSAVGLAFSANLLTFFVFFEMLTMATWPLVFHERGEKDIFSGRKYLIYTLIPGQLFLAGIVVLYVLCGTLDFVPGGFVEAGSAGSGVLIALFFLLVSAGAVKAGVMPFHGWLPSAMVAPTPVSALLHAVAVVKAGAFCVIRVIGYVFGPALLREIGAARILSWFAIFTILCSSLIAMKQDNLKRRLAFSTVGQLSYIVLGACLLGETAFAGACFHIVAHALMKITLFMCAGAIIVTAHKDNISEMHGIGRQMPVTLGCYTVASLGIAGMPFIVGFASKWNIAVGALEVNAPFAVAVLIASAMLSVTYLMPLAAFGFFGKNKNGDFTSLHEANKWMLIPLVCTGALCVVLGIAPNFGVSLYDFSGMAAAAVFQ